MNPALHRGIVVVHRFMVGSVDDNPHRAFLVVVCDQQHHGSGEVRVTHQGMSDQESSRLGWDDCIIIHYPV